VGQVDQAQAHSNKHMCMHELPAIMAVRACHAQTHAQYQAHVCMSCQHAWHAQPWAIACAPQQPQPVHAPFDTACMAGCMAGGTGRPGRPGPCVHEPANMHGQVHASPSSPSQCMPPRVPGTCRRAAYATMPSHAAALRAASRCSRRSRIEDGRLYTLYAPPPWDDRDHRRPGPLTPPRVRDMSDSARGSRANSAFVCFRAQPRSHPHASPSARSCG
jgi:hypothetical protein